MPIEEVHQVTLLSSDVERTIGDPGPDGERIELIADPLGEMDGRYQL